MSKVTEVGRIIISVLLLTLTAFLFYFGIQTAATNITLTLALTNPASAIIGAVITYWLRPLG